MLRCFFKLLIISFFLLGCTVHTPSVKDDEIVALATLLHTVNPQASHHETMQLSQDILTKTAQLAKTFEMTSPPQFHNFLVNVGLKEKGLCYHWSDALYVHFVQSRAYPSFEFHLVGANIGSYWTEHNSMVVVGRGMKVEEGVIIDPWRDAGKLYFSKLKEDSAYEWKHRADRGCQSKR